MHATLSLYVDPRDGLDHVGRGRVPELPLQTVKEAQYILKNDPRTNRCGGDYDEDLDDKAVVKVTSRGDSGCIIRQCSQPGCHHLV
jgi:hypothetical protein